MSEPEWDGERIDGRPVDHCLECGALWFVTDIRYEGEGFGRPRFSYLKDEQVPYRADPEGPSDPE